MHRRGSVDTAIQLRRPGGVAVFVCFLFWLFRRHTRSRTEKKTKNKMAWVPVAIELTRELTRADHRFLFPVSVSVYFLRRFEELKEKNVRRVRYRVFFVCVYNGIESSRIAFQRWAVQENEKTIENHWLRWIFLFVSGESRIVQVSGMMRLETILFAWFHFP